MNNDKFYSIANLIPFEPNKNETWNFYEWNYSPNLIIDLSLSHFHRVKAPDDIHIYYKKPKIGNFYVIQFEVAYQKYIFHHGIGRIKIRSSPYIPWQSGAPVPIYFGSDFSIFQAKFPYIDDPLFKDKHPDVNIIYIIFLCTTGDGTKNDNIYLDVFFFTRNLWEGPWPF